MHIAFVAVFFFFKWAANKVGVPSRSSTLSPEGRSASHERPAEASQGQPGGNSRQFEALRGPPRPFEATRPLRQLDSIHDSIQGHTPSCARALGPDAARGAGSLPSIAKGG